MKKLTALFLSLTMVLGLAACGSTNSSTSSVSETYSATSESENTETGSNTESTDGESSVLVVYFSATGNTDKVANYIADITGGDLFELEPSEPYTDEDLNWTNDNSRVSREYADESLRNIELVSDTMDNWSDYDTVFIGYPIWWGIAAWPVNTFVKANDFTDKTVIPFCTSASSDIGQSGELLAELAGTGDWQEGQRFSSGTGETDVQEWVDDLNLS